MRLFHRHRRHRGESHGPGPHGPGPRGHHARGRWAEELRQDRGGERGRSDIGRLFAHGDLRLVILQLIGERPRHGYEIIKAIEEEAGGAYSPSPGVVYPTLTLLEELGHVTVAPGEGTRKLHSITPEGESMLAANRPALDALRTRVAAAAQARRAEGPHPSVVRAHEGLKLALKLRLARGPLGEDASAAIAAALDAATAAVERS